jgi:hypothetical protein
MEEAMPKFKFIAYRQIRQESRIEIDAADQEAARNAAMAAILIDDVEWSFFETCDEPFEIVDEGSRDDQQ